jgi:hypothetical protein
MEPLARDTTAVTIWVSHLACCSIWPAVPFGLEPMTRDGKTKWKAAETNVRAV